jgi:hypothetical protein
MQHGGCALVMSLRKPQGDYGLVTERECRDKMTSHS